MNEDRAKVTLAGAVIILLFVVGPCVYRGSEREVTITVSEKERVRYDDGGKYLVWSEQGECFEVTDSLSYMSCNASDRYGRLKPGKSYRCKVAGWRIGCSSSYRNIVEFEELRTE